QARSGSLLRQDVVGIAQGTGCDRQAPAADAARELIAQARETIDAIVELRLPLRRHSTPVRDGRGATLGQCHQSVTDPLQWNAHALCDLDDGGATEHVAR